MSEEEVALFAGTDPAWLSYVASLPPANRQSLVAEWRLKGRSAIAGGGFKDDPARATISVCPACNKYRLKLHVGYDYVSHPMKTIWIWRCGCGNWELAGKSELLPQDPGFREVWEHVNGISPQGEER